jgi:hypothetical protein
MTERTFLSYRRRRFLQDAAAVGGVAAAGWLPGIALAQAPKLKVGLMLPYTGTFASSACDLTASSSRS